MNQLNDMNSMNNKWPHSRRLLYLGIGLMSIFGPLHRAHAVGLECPKELRRYQDTLGDTKVVWCQHEDKKEGPLEVYDLKGNFLLKSKYYNNKLHGPFKRYYNSGRLQVEGEYRDGVETGTWTRYWENGNIRDSGLMAGGKPTGVWKFYDQNGKLSKEKTPKDDSIVKNEWHIRTSYIRIDSGPTFENRPESFALGTDYSFWQMTNWVRLRVTFDIAKMRVANRLMMFPYTKTWGDMWGTMLTLGPELNWPGSPRLTFGIRAGNSWLESDHDFPGKKPYELKTHGFELRYRFKEPILWKINSVFYNEMKSNERTYYGYNTQISYLGVTFILN